LLFILAKILENSVNECTLLFIYFERTLEPAIKSSSSHSRIDFSGKTVFALSVKCLPMPLWLIFSLRQQDIVFLGQGTIAHYWSWCQRD